MKLEINIISRQEARILAPEWPAIVSFGRRFAQFHEERYGMKSGFAHIRNAGGSILFPLQWDSKAAYAVHKAHTWPLVIGGPEPVIDWQEVAQKIRQITGCNLVRADFAITGSMTEGLNKLFLAVFTLMVKGKSSDQILSECNKTTRNLVRRAQDKPLSLKILKGIRIPPDLYNLYVQHQTDLGTPPRARDYFDSLAQAFGDGFIIIAAYDGDQSVGMNLILHEDRGLWLLINSSNSEYRDRHINHLLYFEMIRWACENGIYSIDFGGSSTRDGNVHNSFKLGFGASMTPLYRLTEGSLFAVGLDIFSRKKRALRIRFNKLKKLWKN